MLVLSRRVGEAIVLPELNIRISVELIKPGSVRLGITAPKQFHVLREELQPKSTDDTIAVSAVSVISEDVSAAVS